MAQVTYYVALPFLAADDGVAAGEPTECFNPNAAVMRADALSRTEGNVALVTLLLAISAMPGDQEIWRRPRRFECYDPSIHLR